jgi:ATP-dependent Clp protease protease subunit
MKQPPVVLLNYSFSNQGSGTCDVHIDGDIVDAPTQEILKNWFGDDTSVSFKSFRDQVQKANPKTLNVYVNSPGGSVSDAMAMHDYLNELEGKGVTVNRIGRGIIASAATYIMMGNNSQMTENSMMMIHNIQMIAYGDINDCENQVRGGRKFNDLVTNFYVNQTGKPKETISAWMNKETWMSAKDAKENGFVKNVGPSASFSNSIKAEHWPFADRSILNKYNSFTNSKSSVMKIADNISTAVMNALKESGIIKNAFKADEEAIKKMANTIATAIEKEVSAGLDQKVKDAVALAVKNSGGTEGTVNVEEVVKNTLQEELKKTGEGSIAQAITDAVAIVLKNSLDKNERIQKIETDMKNLTDSVAKKLGGKGQEKDEVTDNTKTRKVENKRGFYQVGNFGDN